jgi:hypothetical protein
LHHRNDLKGGAWVSHLIPGIRDHRRRLALPRNIGASGARSLIGAENGRAVAILDAVDEGRCDPLAAINHH